MDVGSLLNSENYSFSRRKTRFFWLQKHVKKVVLEPQNSIFKKLQNVDIMYLVGLGDTLGPGKHSGTDLKALDTFWNDLVKILKNHFFFEICILRVTILHRI